jgi:hypothetical protein
MDPGAHAVQPSALRGMVAGTPVARGQKIGPATIALFAAIMKAKPHPTSASIVDRPESLWSRIEAWCRHRINDALSGRPQAHDALSRHQMEPRFWVFSSPDLHPVFRCEKKVVARLHVESRVGKIPILGDVARAGFGAARLVLGPAAIAIDAGSRLARGEDLGRALTGAVGGQIELTTEPEPEGGGSKNAMSRPHCLFIILVAWVK